MSNRIYAVKNGVYSDFGPVQWGYMKNTNDGTKDGWVQVSEEQYKAATDTKKKSFVPPEVKLAAEPAGSEKPNGEFASVNSGGEPIPPTLKQFVNELVKTKAAWGEITKQVNAKYPGDWKWQALKAAYAANKL